MLRNTLLNLKKACIATLPRIWRGHIVKCNSRFQKVPCLCSSSAKNSKSPKDVAKCKRIIDYIFNNGDFPTGDIKGLPNKELAQFIALKGKLGHPKANKHVLRANRRSLRTNAGAVTTGTRDRQHSLNATASEGAQSLEQKIQKLREIAPVEADKVEKYLSRFYDSTNYEAKRQVAITFIDDTTRIELLKEINKDHFTQKAYLDDPPLVENGAEVLSEPKVLNHSIKAAQPNFTTKKEEEHLAQKIEKIEDPPLVEAGETAEVSSEPKIMSHGVINKPAIFTLPKNKEPSFIFKFRKDAKVFAIPAQKATDKVPLSFVKADKDAKEAENLKKLAAFAPPNKENEEIVQKIEQLLKEPSINIKKVTEAEKVQAEPQVQQNKPLWMNINRVEVDNLPAYSIAAKPLFRDKPPKIDEDLFKRNIIFGTSAAESKVTKKYSRFGRHQRPCTPMFNTPKHIVETEQRIAQSSHLTPLLLTSGSDPLKRGSDIGGSSSVSPSSTTEPVQNPRSLEEELKNWDESQTIKHEEEGDEGDYFKALEKPDGKPLLQFKQIKHKIKQAIVSKTAPFMETPVVSMHTGAGEMNTSSSKQDQNPIQNNQSPAINAIQTQGVNLIQDKVLQNQLWAGQRKSESQYFLPLTTNWVSASQNATSTPQSHKYFLPLSKIQHSPTVNTLHTHTYLTSKDAPLDPPETLVPASFPSKECPQAIQEPQSESKVVLMSEMKSDGDSLLNSGGVRSYKTDSAESTWKRIQDKFKENTFGFNVLKQLSKPIATKAESSKANTETAEKVDITQPASTQPASTQPASTQPADTQPASAQPDSIQPAKSDKWKFFNIVRANEPAKDICNSKDERPAISTIVPTGRLQVDHEDLYGDQHAGLQSGKQPVTEIEAERPLAKITEESDGPPFLRDISTPFENKGLESIRKTLISKVKAEDRPFSRIERHSSGSSGGDPPSLLKSVKLDSQDVMAAGYESDPNTKFVPDVELQPVIQDDDDDELKKTGEKAKSNLPIGPLPNLQNSKLNQLLQMYKIKQDVDRQNEHLQVIENPSLDDLSECMVMVPADCAIATKPAMPAAKKPKRPKFCPVQAKRCRRRKRRKCKRRKRKKCRRKKRRKCKRRKRKCKRRRKKKKCKRRKRRRKCKRKKRRRKCKRKKRRKCKRRKKRKCKRRRKKRKCRRKKRKCRRKKRKCKRKKRKCKRKKRKCKRAKPKCKPKCKAKPKCKCVDVGANLPFDISKPTLFVDVLPESRLAIEGECSRDARLDTSDLPMMPAAKTSGLGLIWENLVWIRGLDVNKQEILQKQIMSPSTNASSATSRFYTSLNNLLNCVTFGNYGKRNVSVNQMIDTRVV